MSTNNWTVGTCAFNPALERSFHGLEVSKGVTFSPNVKVGYDVTKKVTVGFEYYGALGSITGFDPLQDQQQAIMPAVDLNLGPNWEVNFAAGIGMTGGTDHLLVKMIHGAAVETREKIGARGRLIAVAAHCGSLSGALICCQPSPLSDCRNSIRLALAGASRKKGAMRESRCGPGWPPFR